MTRTYQLSSLADLFAFRFRSTWAGALTTLYSRWSVCCRCWPCRIKAVADARSACSPMEPVQGNRVALSVLHSAGAVHHSVWRPAYRHARKSIEGLVFAIAFESLVKLIAIGLLSAVYALYGVFGSPG